MKIVVDAMGGDNAPIEIIKGAINATISLGVEIILCGDEDIIKEELKKYESTKGISIVNCSQKIENEDDPIRAIRSKKDSSMVRAMDILKAGGADAMISAGNTGALIAVGVFKLGRLNNVDRPALTPIIPTNNGFSVMLDVGANTICNPKNLYQFAVMGSFYIEKIYDRANPKIGLVNVGVEEHKGTPLTKETFKLLKESKLNFIGNLEARDIPYGVADVIVTDGFTGNIILKLTEGLGMVLISNIKDVFMKTLKGKIAGLMVKKGMTEFKNKMDYKEYGGAPLLGLNGVVIKAHGSSDARAFESAIRQSQKFVDSKVLDSIREYLKNDGSELKDK